MRCIRALLVVAGVLLVSGAPEASAAGQPGPAVRSFQRCVVSQLGKHPDAKRGAVRSRCCQAAPNKRYCAAHPGATEEYQRLVRRATGGAGAAKASGAGSSNASTSVGIDEAALGRALGEGWTAKEGTAVEYHQGDHNYRTWEIHQSPTSDGGVQVSFKIDHIRGVWADDHAYVDLTLDRSCGVVDSSAEIRLADGNVLMADTEDAIATSAAAAGPEYGAGAQQGTQIANQLLAQMQVFGETGGRELFPGIVEHNINHVVAACGARAW